MLVLNDPQGALDFVWTWEVTTEVNFTGTFYNTATYYIPIRAVCGVWWGNTNNIGIGIVVSGHQYYQPNLRFGPPSGSSFFGLTDRCVITITAPDISWTESTLLSNTIPRRLFEDTTFTAEMDDALLTGLCTEDGFTATLTYSALRIKRNGTIVASTGPKTIADFPYDPRRNHFRLDPYTGPIDYDVIGGVPYPIVPVSGGYDNEPWQGANILEHNEVTRGRMGTFFDPPAGIIS